MARFATIPGPDVPIRSRFNHYRTRARLRNKPWELSFEVFKTLVLQNCRYCGQPPHMLVKTRNHKCLLNGVDRIDSDEGYVLGNCFPSCRPCNGAKGNMSIIEFFNWLGRIGNAFSSNQ